MLNQTVHSRGQHLQDYADEAVVATVAAAKLLTLLQPVRCNFKIC